MPRPFHLAFPVANLDATRAFYEGLLQCGVGRTDPRWIDFDFFGHQISAHLRPEELRSAKTNAVDGDAVPVRHFGVILTLDDWKRLADRVQTAGVEFIIEPKIRFVGEPGEQATMFFLDPSGNALEFKAFADDAAIFATE